MRRAVAVTIGLSLTLLAASPADAASVSIVDFAFSPQIVTTAQGTSVMWTNDGDFTHTSTQNGPLALWNTGSIPPGDSDSSGTIRGAGVYPYRCTIHPSLMTGKVRVPIQVSPTSGTTSTDFTITLASATQSGIVYDVQRKVGDGTWQSWMTGVTTRTVTFDPTSAGVYRFRSRIRRTSDGAKSGYSPAKKITVT